MERQNFVNGEITAEILELIKGHMGAPGFQDLLSDYHEYDIAQAAEQLTREERTLFYKSIDLDWAAEIFAYYSDAQGMLLELSPKQAAEILERMDADEAVEALDGMDPEFRKAAAGYLSEEAKVDIRKIASYEDEEIGNHMTTNYIEIGRHLTVKEAMRELIRQTQENDNISTLYVTEEGGQFYGVIDLKDLILARDYTPLEDIISNAYPFVHDHDKIKDRMEWLKEYEEDSIPVLNQDNTLIGVLTVQDILDYMDEEARGVYNKLAGIAESDSPDMKETLLESMKKRLPWLLALLVLGIGVSTVVGAFEQVVAQIALLVSFQSLILDMAGNVGTQSLAVTIRVLMDENMTTAMKGRLIWKEVKVGLSNGLVLGGITFLVVAGYVYLTKGKSPLYVLALAACVGLALLASMVISSLTGTVIPLFFEKIKVDPAVASGPLITTVNDLVAVVTYYGLAWFLLLNVLHIA